MPKLTANKPATSLPWKWSGQIGANGDHFINGAQDHVTRADPQDAAYIVTACNAFPQLVAALRELMLRCDGEEGVRADGSNIQTIAASGLLQSLGELE